MDSDHAILMEIGTKEDVRRTLEEQDNQERSTKKIKPTHEELVPPTISASPYRDSLLGHHGREQEARQRSEEFLDDMDQEVEEIEIVQGTIPKVVFPAKAHEIMSQSWKRAVIAKIVGRNINYHLLCAKATALWKLQMNFEVVDLGQGYYVFRFEHPEDYLKVLTEGPWVIMGHYLAIQSWKSGFRPSEAKLTSLVAWVRFPELPLDYYREKYLLAIASVIGKPLRADYASTNVVRGKFARVCVELDLSKPLVSRIDLDGSFQQVVYEGLYTVCFGCGRFGHRTDTCPESNSVASTSEPSKVEHRHHSDASGGSDAVERDSPSTVVLETQGDVGKVYGPEMLAPRQNRRAARHHGPGTSKPKANSVNHNNRFGVLSDRDNTDDATEEPPLNGDGWTLVRGKENLRPQQGNRSINTGNAHGRKGLKPASKGEARTSTALGGQKPGWTANLDNTQCQKLPNPKSADASKNYEAMDIERDSNRIESRMHVNYSDIYGEHVPCSLNELQHNHDPPFREKMVIDKPAGQLLLKGVESADMLRIGGQAGQQVMEVPSTSGFSTST